MAKRWKKVEDDDMDASTQRLLAALRAAVITEFETLTAAGLNPYHLRYCALTAHIISMADMIGASTSDDDRWEMREFVKEGGMTMLSQISEQVADFAEDMDMEGKLN
jgi:hypothetical protein